jgi:hypothetical protein
MPAPTNISFATATDLGSTFPINVTQQIDNAGIYYTVYYKITVAANVVLGWWAYGDAAFDYIPRVTIYLSNQITQLQNFGSMDDMVCVIPLAIGTYYFKIEAVGTKLLSPATLTISVVETPDNSYASGDILIMDDSHETSLSINSQDDGTVSKYIYSFSAGEYGVTVPNYLITLDSWTDTMKIYSTAFNLLTEVDAWPGLNAGQDTVAFLGSNHDTHAYWGVIDNGLGVASVKKISIPDGAVLDTYSPLYPSVINAAMAAAANSDDTILYYSDADVAGNKPIKRWDLVNNVGLSNLAVGIAGYRNLDINVLADDTILVLFYDGIATDTIVKQYSIAGAILNTYNFGDIQHNADSVPRMCTSIDNQTSFWLYLKSEHDAFVEFLNIKISDGSTLADYTSINTFSDGKSSVYSIAVPASTPRSGPSPSCPIMLLNSAEVPIEGGLYIQKMGDPINLDDNPSFSPIDLDRYFTGSSLTATIDTAIPDPTVIIYPAGD